MTAAIASSPVTQSVIRYKVNSYWLLALYAIIPLCFILVALDYWAFDGAVKAILPSNPMDLVIWAVIFNFPHITSSLITLADDEYIPFYKKRFLRILLLIALAVLTLNLVVPLLVSKQGGMLLFALFFAFYASYTMYHVLSQQFGVGMILMKAKSGTPAYERWRWTGAIAASFMYGMVFAKNAMFSIHFGQYSFYQVANGIALVFIVLSALQGLWLTKQSQRKLGTYYVLSNIAMLFATYVLLNLGYEIFVIAIPRFVHDITALSIYSVHDQNRNSIKAHNYFYRFLSFLKVPPIILCTLLAIVVANIVQCGSFLADGYLGFSVAQNTCALSHFYTPSTVADPIPASMQIWLQILFICGFFHYYIEGFVWKRDAIHRHAIAFK